MCRIRSEATVVRAPGQPGTASLIRAIGRASRSAVLFGLPFGIVFGLYAMVPVKYREGDGRFYSSIDPLAGLALWALASAWASTMTGLLMVGAASARRRRVLGG
jgi:hypothetical protein